MNREKITIDQNDTRYNYYDKTPSQPNKTRKTNNIKMELSSFDRDNLLTIKSDSFKLILKLVRNANNNFEILIHTMQPSGMMVGDTLEEAQNLVQIHRELCQKLKARKNQITEYVLMQESPNDLSLLWESTEKQLEIRGLLLDQSVRFHLSAESFLNKMNCAQKFIEDSTENEISNAELGHSLLEEYQKIKKGNIYEGHETDMRFDYIIMKP